MMMIQFPQIPLYPPQSGVSRPQFSAAGPKKPAPSPADSTSFWRFLFRKPANTPQKKSGKGLLGTMLRIGANLFHIGAVGFLIVGAPFVPGPWWIPLLAAAGVQLLQNWAQHLYPDADVLDAKKMASVTQHTLGQLKHTLNSTEKKLDNTLFVRHLNPIYKRLFKWLYKTAEHGIPFLSNQIVHQGISLHQMPPTLMGKMTYLAKLTLKQSILVFSKPLGPLGVGIAAFFNAGEVNEFTSQWFQNNTDTQPSSKPKKRKPR